MAPLNSSSTVMAAGRSANVTSAKANPSLLHSGLSPLATRLGIPTVGGASGASQRTASLPGPTKFISQPLSVASVGQSTQPTTTMEGSPSSSTTSIPTSQGNGNKVGGIIAGTLLPILAVIIGFWFYWRRRQRLRRLAIDAGEPCVKKGGPHTRLLKVLNNHTSRLFKRDTIAPRPFQVAEQVAESSSIQSCGPAKAVAHQSRVDIELPAQAEPEDPFRDPDPAPTPIPIPAPSVKNTYSFERIQKLAGQLETELRQIQSHPGGPTQIPDVDNINLSEIRRIVNLMAGRNSNSGSGGHSSSPPPSYKSGLGTFSLATSSFDAPG